MDKTGADKKRLTYFNDPTAPEYLGKRTIVAASDFSPDGKHLVGILGVDFGGEESVDMELKIVLIKLEG